MLRQEVISGVGWATASRIARQIVGFAVTVVLARILTPDDFGLVGMIVVFTGFAGLLTDSGFGAALVQRTQVEERHLSSVFWLSLGLGVCITVVTVLAAPMLAAFYGRAVLTPLTCVVAFNFTIVSLKIVPLALVRRSMNFKLLAIVNTMAVVLSGTIGIVLALSDFGVWALVWQTITLSSCTALGLWLVTEWRPCFSFELGAIKDLLRFSANLLGFRSFNYWVRNADNLVIGKVVGADALGIYSRAYGTMLLPIRQVTSVITQVMLPGLSRIQDDISRVKRAYLRATRAIGLITVPMMMGLFVVADSFVLATFGPKWVQITPILRILCLVGVIQPIGSTAGWLYNSQGRTDRQFKWGVATGLFYLLSFAIGVQWGVIGVAVAYAIGNYIVFYPSILLCGSLVQLSFREFINNLAGIFATALIMTGVVAAVSTFVPDSWSQPVTLAVEVTVGVSVYWATLEIFKVRAYLESKELFLQQSRRLGKGASLQRIAR